MSYEEKFETVKDSILIHFRELIIQNWNKSFDMWLSMEADMEFGHGYQNKFKKQFSKYMNEKIENDLWLAGKNIIFAINAFMSYNEDAEMQDVIHFVMTFVTEQLDDFDNWCDDISQAMYEESSEYEREFDKKVENKE